MSDDPTQSLPPDLTAPPPKPWLTWILVGLFVLGIAAWFGGTPLLKEARHLIGTRQAEAARKAMARKDWQKASEAIRIARRWAPDDAEVERVVADYLFKTNSDPSGLIYTLRRLEETGRATTEDRVHLGQALLSQNSIAAARTVLASLSEAERSTRLPLELEANILRQEGRVDEAEEVLRRSLLLAPEDPAARLRLAALDHQSPFSEMRQRARQSVWELARGKDQTGLSAIGFLAAIPELSSVEADELLKLIEAHPDAPPGARLQVVSALIRLRPHLRSNLVDAEVARFKGRPPGDLAILLKWLNQEGEHERLLKLTPEHLALKSAEILEAKLEALARLNRWPEVQKLLAKPAGLPLSASLISVWMADAYRHLDKDASRARQQLITAFEASGRGKQAQAAMRAAQIAEELGLWDVASRCYAGIAAIYPQAEISMLEKVREMSLRDRDTQALMQAVQRLVELRPTNPAYADSLLYLQLVAGETIELTLKTVNERRTEGHGIPDGLFKALAAYRMGDLEAVKENLPGIANPDGLPPGQRAVYAGLLSTSGQVGPAFNFAEKVPAALLLEEELRFLRRAR